MKKFLFALSIILFAQNCCFAEQPTQINNGRYVLYQHPTFKADQYILDNKTGKIWQLVKTKEGYNVWEEMFYDCFNENKTYLGRFVTPR